MASWWVQALVIAVMAGVLAGLVVVAWRHRSRRRPQMPLRGDADTYEFPRHRGRRRRARAGGWR